MEFFSVGKEAVGFIAIGQKATGFIAIGQIATGFIAIGQLSRGVFAIGQVALGLVGWGQFGVGILHAIGMLAVGGRGLGLAAVRLVPSLGRARVPPPTTPLDAVGRGTSGWVDVELRRDESGMGLYDNGNRLPIKLDRQVLAGARRVAGTGPVRVYAFAERIGGRLVCRRIVHMPPRPYQQPNFPAIAAFQCAVLMALGIAYWPAVGNDLMDFAEKAFAEEAPPVASPPRAAPRAPTPPRRR